MGFFFLYFLLLVLIPLSVGAAMALGLGELYARVYAPELDVSQQEEIGGPDTASETAVTEMGVEMETLKPAPSDSPPSSYGEDAAEQAVPLVVPSEVSLETEDAVSPAGESDPEKEEPEELGEITAPPSASKSVFDDEELVTTDDFGSVIDDMLEEKDKAVPKDLALLIGEDAADTNGNFDDFKNHKDSFDLLCNATPLGMHPKEEQTPVDKSLLNPDMAVFDIVYNPLKTRLLREAEEVGCKTVSGIGMLVHQGLESFKLWFPDAVPSFEVALKSIS